MAYEHLHAESDGTFTAALPLKAGGTQVVSLRLPPLMRRMAINSAVAAAFKTKDTYTWQCAAAAALALGWTGPSLEIGTPATRVVELGEQATDALDAKGFDVFSEAFAGAGSDLLGAIIDSLSEYAKADKVATEEAAQVFPDSEEGEQQ